MGSASHFHLLECFDAPTSTCPATGQCRLEKALQVARDAFLAELDFCTLADVVGDGAHLPRVEGLVIGRGSVEHPCKGEAGGG